MDGEQVEGSLEGCEWARVRAEGLACFAVATECHRYLNLELRRLVSVLLVTIGVTECDGTSLFVEHYLLEQFRSDDPSACYYLHVISSC